MTAIITNISRVPRATATPPVRGRSIHLIDIENLCGSSQPSRHEVEHARARYSEWVPVGNLDQVVVASSRGNLMSAFIGWPGARYLSQDGKDGADICLARVIVDEGIEHRFDNVVLASGDGGLAPFVAHLATKGLNTTVVSPANRLSRQMRMAAHKCIVLTPELEDIA